MDKNSRAWLNTSYQEPESSRHRVYSAASTSTFEEISSWAASFNEKVIEMQRLAKEEINMVEPLVKQRMETLENYNIGLTRILHSWSVLFFVFIKWTYFEMVL
jgi:HPt (histidine-containing phosphotransfer) domain-containing protein